MHYICQKTNVKKNELKKKTKTKIKTKQNKTKKKNKTKQKQNKKKKQKNKKNQQNTLMHKKGWNLQLVQVSNYWAAKFNSLINAVLLSVMPAKRWSRRVFKDLYPEVVLLKLTTFGN